MDLNDFTVGPRVDPDVVATWVHLASVNGEGTEYRVYWSDDGIYHVVDAPDGPSPVIVAVGDHGDYVSALRAVAACIEEEDFAAGRHAATPLDITPRLRIRRTWFCDAGSHSGKFGVGLEPLYVTEEELEQLQATYGRKEDN